MSLRLVHPRPGGRRGRPPKVGDRVRPRAPVRPWSTPSGGPVVPAGLLDHWARRGRGPLENGDPRGSGDPVRGTEARESASRQGRVGRGHVVLTGWTGGRHSPQRATFGSRTGRDFQSEDLNSPRVPQPFLRFPARKSGHPLHESGRAARASNSTPTTLTLAPTVMTMNNLCQHTKEAGLRFTSYICPRKPRPR